MSERRLTVHLIGNAHIDPVWLWRSASGVDEVVNTCRTACELLDEFPALRFTKGEAWGYSVVERYAPEVFQRIAAHVATGRWTVVNGWWIQPDCNFPLEESLLAQSALGGPYFRSRFNIDVKVGYNVDTFGHSAFLPRILTKAGIPYYIFMRPNTHEMSLPANLFTWRAPSGEEVTAFHLGSRYTTSTLDQLEQNVAEAIRLANREFGHTMCFFGVGDHGGGPTREQINWILEHYDYAEDVRLEISDPNRFFAEYEKTRPDLPVVDSELQQHAIGCYAVAHDFRKQLRRAEWLLLQAEPLADHNLEALWETIAFHHFHDITGGCSIASAMKEAREQVDRVVSECRIIVADAVRRFVSNVNPSDHQQILLYCASDLDFFGPVEIEPWVGYPWLERLDAIRVFFRDEEGREVPMQAIVQESAATLMRRYMLDLDVPARGIRTITLHKEPSASPIAHPCELAAPAPGTVRVGRVEATLSKRGIARLSWRGEAQDPLRRSAPAFSTQVTGIEIAVYDDPSDTWSHGIDRYSTDAKGVFTATTGWSRTESGPLRHRFVNTIRFAHSRADLALSIYDSQARVEIFLRLYWSGVQEIAKLLVRPGFRPARRLDGVPGGVLARALDGRELPIQNQIHLGDDRNGITIVTGDIFAADVQPDGLLRLTLVRSPYFAHHLPYYPAKHEALFPVTDQGMHEYRISLLAGTRDDVAVRREIVRHMDPISMGETTRGMESR